MEEEQHHVEEERHVQTVFRALLDGSWMWILQLWKGCAHVPKSVDALWMASQDLLRVDDETATEAPVLVLLKILTYPNKRDADSTFYRNQIRKLRASQPQSMNEQKRKEEVLRLLEEIVIYGRKRLEVLFLLSNSRISSRQKEGANATYQSGCCYIKDWGPLTDLAVQWAKFPTAGGYEEARLTMVHPGPFVNEMVDKAGVVPIFFDIDAEDVPIDRHKDFAQQVVACLWSTVRSTLESDVEEQEQTLDSVEWHDVGARPSRSAVDALIERIIGPPEKTGKDFKIHTALVLSSTSFTGQKAAKLGLHVIFPFAVLKGIEMAHIVHTVVASLQSHVTVPGFRHTLWKDVLDTSPNEGRVANLRSPGSGKLHGKPGKFSGVYTLTEVYTGAPRPLAYNGGHWSFDGSIISEQEAMALYSLTHIVPPHPKETCRLRDPSVITECLPERGSKHTCAQISERDGLSRSIAEFMGGTELFAARGTGGVAELVVMKAMQRDRATYVQIRFTKGAGIVVNDARISDVRQLCPHKGGPHASNSIVVNVNLDTQTARVVCYSPKYPACRDSRKGPWRRFDGCAAIHTLIPSERSKFAMDVQCLSQTMDAFLVHLEAGTRKKKKRKASEAATETPN